MKLKLGRVRGITLDVDISWVIIFAVVTYSLGAGYFGFLYPSWGPVLVWGMALAASALFFASVVGHELAHSLVAQRHGIQVDSITLFLLGGVARIRSEPTDPRVELQIALAGPAASLGLGALFAVPHALLGGMEGGNPIGVAATYLMLINVVVALFNMVPGLPLDGGRVLRALLWWRSGNPVRATQYSAVVGQGFGVLLIGGGLLIGLNGSLFNSIWFVLVGWFMMDAARSATAQALSQHALAGKTLAEVMGSPAEGVPADTSLQEVVDGRLGYSLPGPLAVLAEGEVAGLVGTAEVKRVERARWPATPAREAMVPLHAYPAAASDSDAWDTLVRMSEQNLESMVVLDEGRFRGVVSLRSLLGWARRGMVSDA